MYLVLIEHMADGDGDHDWHVCSEAERVGCRTGFLTREAAEEYVHERAALVPNRFAVVRIMSTFRREESVVSIVETRVAS